MLTWAREDVAAAVAHLVALDGGRRITVMGHSLGLRHAGIPHPGTQALIAHAIGVGSGAGYWRLGAALAPRCTTDVPCGCALITPLFGYFPGKRLGMVGDLPAPAIRQWSRPEFTWGGRARTGQPKPGGGAVCRDGVQLLRRRIDDCAMHAQVADGDAECAVPTGAPGACWP